MANKRRNSSCTPSFTPRRHSPFSADRPCPKTSCRAGCRARIPGRGPRGPRRRFGSASLLQGRARRGPPPAGRRRADPEGRRLPPAARRDARWISQPLPPDHADEGGRGEGAGRPGPRLARRGGGRARRAAGDSKPSAAVPTPTVSRRSSRLSARGTSRCDVQRHRRREQMRRARPSSTWPTLSASGPWPPTACAMRRRAAAPSPTSSPAFAKRRRWRPPAGCWPRTPSAI